MCVCAHARVHGHAMGKFMRVSEWVRAHGRVRASVHNVITPRLFNLSFFPRARISAYIQI